jgi:sulfoxide reductase heme-binding subunit YedZ
MDKRTRLRVAWWAVLALSAAPLAKLVADLFLSRLGANPVEAILNRLGFWTLTLLLATLAATPANALLGLAWPARVRRLLGLWAFSYATLHLLCYVAVDQGLDLRLLAEDVAKRKFMTVGFTAWLLLVPLAVTSTDRWVQRLGYRTWKRLHRVVYVAAILGVVHFVWRVKADLLRPALFAVALGILLLLRVVPRTWTLRRAKPGGAPAPAARPAGETGSGPHPGRRIQGLTHGP